MRRFILDRVEDVSGVSGTGKVAEGVEFSTGKVAVTWVTEHRSTTVYDSMAEVEAIHGHGGRTVIKYLDLSPEMEKVSKKIADGITAGLKSGIRPASPIELAFAKLETAGVKGALYQSEKERAALEKQLEESRKLREVDEGLLVHLNDVVRNLEAHQNLAAARHAAISDDLAERDAKIERLGKELADANDRSIAYMKENDELKKYGEHSYGGYQWHFSPFLYRVEPGKNGTLVILRRDEMGVETVLKLTIERWFNIARLCGPSAGLEGSIEAKLEEQKEEIKTLANNLANYVGADIERMIRQNSK